MQRREKENSNLSFKSQAAMEYLMTYGWAILIIGLALAVMYGLGVFNPKNFIPKVPPGSCSVFRPYGPGNPDMVRLQGTCGYLPMYVASFDGVDDYVDVGNSASLDFSTGDFTVVVWAKANGGTTARGILNKGGWSSIGYFIQEAYAPNMYYFGVYDNSGSHHEVPLYLYEKWGWTHIVGVKKTNYIEAWVNGVKVGSWSGTIGSLSSPTKKFEIGRSAYYFNGSIANVQIYNTALSQQEIQYLYQQGLGGAPVRLQNLVAWWPLNGDAKDYSGNNLHGTIFGGLSFIQNYNPP